MDTNSRIGLFREAYIVQISEVLYESTSFFSLSQLGEDEELSRMLVKAAGCCKERIFFAAQALEANAIERALQSYLVAREALEKLDIEYRKFAEEAGIPMWSEMRGTVKALQTEMMTSSKLSYDKMRSYVEHVDEVLSLNVILAMVGATIYLLHKEIVSLGHQ